jgi:Leucine rich repeat
MKLLAILLTLINLSQSVVFQCEYWMIEWPQIGEKYACVVYLTETDNGSTVVEVRGDHLNGKSHSDVDVLVSYNSRKLTELPKGIEVFFPNLMGIQWIGGILSRISADDFKPFPNLIMVVLAINNFTDLNGDLFKYTPNLQVVHFDYNKIEKVGSGLLENLESLVHVNFKSNICIDQVATTPQEIDEFKRLLHAQCSPPEETTTKEPSTTSTSTATTTTESNQECLGGCSDRIDEIERKMVEVIGRYEARIAELEKQVREISANPCTPCTESLERI